ncbi:ATP-dependent DNA helicase RecG [Candidatus Hepatobacter penaei]|uniref:ATP-dependent DNA helicase RecG n=1 Tax=Candidatus Hepatobacter penaei TaxID=1274402 RepID=UPI0004F275B7|nr:DEAD/DEAH box helicase [Candidatus Hepatobacter penaei]
MSTSKAYTHHTPLLTYMRSPLSSLRGVGPVSLKRLHNLGLYTRRDLLFHFPTRYECFTPIGHASSDKVCASIRITSCAQHKKYTHVIGTTHPHHPCQPTHPVRLFFHKKQYPYLKQKMQPASLWQVWGKAHHEQGTWVLFFPRFAQNAPDEPIKRDAIYPQTEGLTSQKIAHLVTLALNEMPPAEAWYDQAFLAENNWPSFEEALRRVHGIDHTTPEEQAQAKQRLSFDRLLARHILFHQKKHEQHHQRAISLSSSHKDPDAFFAVLTQENIALTPSQMEAYQTILVDLKKAHPMRRLLQGDVGSGKTLVAFGAMIYAIHAGVRTAFLAPTEILAQQTYEKCAHLLKHTSARAVLLTRTTPHKKACVRDICEGKYDAIIGTHSLLSEGVTIPNLGLVIIDEQQRFGVSQRSTLLTKQAYVPHLLLMTATPIPRTYSLMLRGDVDTSYLQSRVASKRTTTLLPQDHMHSLMPKIREALKAGKKLFWVCPCVEASSEKAAVKKRWAFLKKAFPGQVHGLYGTQPEQEKQKALADFRQGLTPILVCTTIIEIGIDVPDATHMVIENAESFGLAQLHQMRGRIGRQGQESFLVVLYTPPLSEGTRQRLDFFQHNDDGFALAQKDFSLRGEGDILGLRQSGFLDTSLLASPELARKAQVFLQTSALSEPVKTCLLSLFEYAQMQAVIKAA